MVSVTPSHRTAGFTITELMITVVILLILAGVAAPSFISTIRMQRLRSAALALASQINAARAAAQRTGSNCEIALSGTSVIRPSPTSGNCGSASLPPLDLRIESQDAEITATGLTTGSTTFRFSPGGLLVGTTADQTVFINRSGFTPRMCVNVQVPSALVRIGAANNGGTTCTYTSS